MIEPGEKLPKFELPDQSGETRTLSDLARKKGLVLYAYPKDNTSGCTVEAQEFTEHLTAFRRRGYEVVGISKDSVRSHQGFREKHDLRVPMLSDPNAALLEPLGAWGDKKVRGEVKKGIIRSTFVVGADGTVLKVYPTVKVRGHAEQVLADLKEL